MHNHIANQGAEPRRATAHIGWLLMVALSLAGACAGYHMSGRRN
jgi:hypothetical protein